MAGEFPVATPTPGRKQWKIYRGPRGPFRLGTALGEEGSADAHVMYAKQLLEEKCDDALDQVENERLGVYWLLKASEQGHQEATTMLHECLQTGQGITEHNIGDVKSCLDMPLDEKVSRHAAREIFASLSQGEGYITSRQLCEELLRVQEGAENNVSGKGAIDSQLSGSSKFANGRSPRSPISECGSSSSSKTDRVTEDMLIAAASHYCRGQLPLVHLSLELDKYSTPSTSQQSSRSRCNVVVAAIATPITAVASSYARLVDHVATTRPSTLKQFLFGNIQLCLLFAIYSLFGLDEILDLLPSCLYYGSLVVMLVTTCRILSKKWEAKHFKQWSNLLVAWGGSRINTRDCEWSHCLNNMGPSLAFLIALAAHLSVLPFVPYLNVPHSELAVLSVLLSFALLYNYMWTESKLDFTVLVSFVIHMLARYPYDLDPVVSKEWRFLDVHVPSLGSYIIGNGVEFCYKFRVFLYGFLVFLLVTMAARDRWRGLLACVIPHIVCLSWWQMAVISSNGATWYGMIRACLAFVGVLLLVPLAGVAAVVLPAVAVLRSLLALSSIPLPASIAVSAAVLITALYFMYRYKNTSRSSSLTWTQVILVLGSCWVIIAAGSWDSDNTSSSRPPPSISWIEFRNACPAHGIISSSTTSSSSQSLAAAQVACSKLANLHVSWEGRVKSISVTSVDNPLLPVVSRLPQSVQDTVMCMYGERYEDCESDSELASGCINNLPPAMMGKCHLANWNRYTYEVVLSVGSNSGLWSGGGNDEIVKLIGGQIFSNLTLSLFPGDRIWASGRLTVPIPPTVQLISAGCIECSHRPMPRAISTRRPLPDITAVATAATQSVLQFLTTPLTPPPH